MNRTFILREQRNLDVLNAYLKGWEDAAKAGKPFQVEVMPERSKRSAAANRYYFGAVITQIEDQAWLEGVQYSKEAWHEFFARKFLGVVDLPGGGRMAISTANLSPEEFKAFTWQVEEFAQREMGVTFTCPDIDR